MAGLLTVACGNGTEGNAPMPPTSQAEGLITEIRPAEGDPDSFLLETDEHGTFEVFIGGDVDYGFDLEHLREHMDQDLPVRVRLQERDGQTVATQIEDV